MSLKTLCLMSRLLILDALREFHKFYSPCYLMIANLITAVNLIRMPVLLNKCILSVSLSSILYFCGTLFNNNLFNTLSLTLSWLLSLSLSFLSSLCSFLSAPSPLPLPFSLPLPLSYPFSWPLSLLLSLLLALFGFLQFYICSIFNSLYIIIFRRENPTRMDMK